MCSLAQGLIDLMRQISSEWDYGAEFMAFQIPDARLVAKICLFVKKKLLYAVL